MRTRLLPEQRWCQLVDKTVELLGEVPSREVVVDDVASRAGVSRALVYRYFSGSEALVRHANRRFFTRLNDDFDRILELETAPLQQLRMVIAATVYFAAADPRTFCHVVDGRLSSTPTDDPLLQCVLRITEVLRRTRDAAVVATATAACIQSGIVAWLRGDPEDGAEDMIDLLFTLVAHGLGGCVAPADDVTTTATAGLYLVPPRTGRGTSLASRAEGDEDESTCASALPLNVNGCTCGEI